MPVSRETGHGYPATERAGPVVDTSELVLARSTRAVTQEHGAGQDQSPDAYPPSIPTHHAHPFSQSYRPQSISNTSVVRNIHPSRKGHELALDERPHERQPPRRAEDQPHSSPLFINTGQEQKYHLINRRTPQISPMEYDYDGIQSPLSPQALIPPLQLLLRAPADPAGADGGNRVKFAGRQHSPPPSGHYGREQHLKLDSRGSSQLRHHPYRHSPPQPSRRHSESLSPQGPWTHSPRELQHSQQYQPQQQQCQEQHHPQHHQQQQQHQHQQQWQQQQQQQQLSSDQASSREQLVSQNRRRESMELGRQQVKGFEGEEMRPMKYEQRQYTNATRSGTSSDRGQPRLQPFNIQPLGAMDSPASPGQAQEKTPTQSRSPARMTLALSFSNAPTNTTTSRVDQRTLTPQHQYHAQRLSHQHQQGGSSRASAALVNRLPPSPQGDAHLPSTPTEYHRQGPVSETGISETQRHRERRVSFIEDTLNEVSRPHMITRGSSLEARWEPRPRALDSSASSQEPYDENTFPDPALPRRYSAADALELRSQDRRGGVRFKQEHSHSMRSNSLVAAPGDVCSAHYAAAPLKPEQQEWPNGNLRDPYEHSGRQHPRQDQPQQHRMFVDVRGRELSPGSSSGGGGQLSSTLASPTERSSRNDMSSSETRLEENGHRAKKQEFMEIELPPGAVAVETAAAEISTGMDTAADYRSAYMELESLPSPVPQSDLGQPGYYTETDIQKLYWQWRKRKELEKRFNQQSQHGDRDDVSMGGAEEGDDRDGGGTDDAWTESQHEVRNLRDGPELRHSSQEGEGGGGGAANKGKSRKVEKASGDEDHGMRRGRGRRSKEYETQEWDFEKEENEDDADYGEEDSEEEDVEEEGDDGYCESEDGDDGEGLEDGSVGKSMAEDRDDGKHAVARRTRTQTGRKEGLRRDSGTRSAAPSRAGTSASGDGPRRTRAKDDKKHGCDECQKRFSRPSQLKTHQLTHSGEKPHQCHLCDKHFNVASNLKRHIRTHDKIPRKYSRDGSGVFRGFTQGFQGKHSPSMKGSSLDAIRRARAAKTSLGSTVATLRRPAGSTQHEKLRWMSTETPESSMMAASKQAKVAASKQRSTGESASSSSSRLGGTTSPSEASIPANARRAAVVSIEAGAFVACPSPLTGSSAASDRPPQSLPPPTPQPSRESDSESTLVDGTPAS
ncbi:unnamed protein product [Mortierella alpina]